MHTTPCLIPAFKFDMPAQCGFGELHLQFFTCQHGQHIHHRDVDVQLQVPMLAAKRSLRSACLKLSDRLQAANLAPWQPRRRCAISSLLRRRCVHACPFARLIKMRGLECPFCCRSVDRLRWRRAVLAFNSFVFMDFVEARAPLRVISLRKAGAQSFLLRACDQIALAKRAAGSCRRATQKRYRLPFRRAST